MLLISLSLIGMKPDANELQYVKSKKVTNIYLLMIVYIRVYVIETKGLEDLDVPLKLQRLAQWCEDINIIQKQIQFNWLYIQQEKFGKYNPSDFSSLIKVYGADKEKR